jgi:hypothetical protein
MNVNQLYQNLSYGEFSNLAMSGEGSGTIIEAYRPRVILAANEALLRLYGRYILKERDVVIEQMVGITNYHLNKRFAQMTKPQVEKKLYIKDMALEPFEDDVIKILCVYNSFGVELPLNDPELVDSLFTPQANVLQVPRVQPGVALSVQYQASHVPLDHIELEQPIELPTVLHGALTAYTAYKIFSQINTAESNAKAQEHFANYESICQGAVEGDLIGTSISATNTRFTKRGWI